MRGDGFLANNRLEHVIICNEAALYRHVKSFVVYYHASRTHLALGQEAPEARPVQPLEHGPVIAIPQVGGLHPPLRASRSLNAAVFNAISIGDADADSRRPTEPDFFLFANCRR
jgi:hypothetical protein